MNIINKIAKINKNKKTRNKDLGMINSMNRLLLSIFLAFMVVIWPIEGDIERTIISFIVFIILYYFFVSNRILNFSNPLTDCTINEASRKEKKYLKKVSAYIWFVPFLVIGIGSLVLSILTIYYLKLSEKFSGTQKFWDYSATADSFPKFIYLLIFISIFIFFLIQIYFSFKLKNISKNKIVGLSFISTISVFFICLFVILIGIVLYYIGGSFFY